MFQPRFREGFVLASRDIKPERNLALFVDDYSAWPVNPQRRVPHCGPRRCPCIRSSGCAEQRLQEAMSWHLVLVSSLCSDRLSSQNLRPSSIKFPSQLDAIGDGERVSFSKKKDAPYLDAACRTVHFTHRIFSNALGSYWWPQFLCCLDHIG